LTKLDFFAAVCYIFIREKFTNSHTLEAIILRKILLIEDDSELAEHLSEFLKTEGFAVTHCLGQSDGLARFGTESFDCILVDISLVDGNGFTVCASVRAKSDIPLIFLTASGDESCTVAGFELGADDYIAKPFRPRELAARIKNAIRRKGGSPQELKCGSLSVDSARGTVTKNGAEIFLSALEYRLLLTFLTNRGQLLSRDRLIEELWAASGEFVSDNTLTVYIKRLREKVEDNPQKPEIIKTVRGMGYKVGE
jgi:DNA-binding response OmpR family regulator